MKGKDEGQRKELGREGEKLEENEERKEGEGGRVK